MSQLTNTNNQPGQTPTLYTYAPVAGNPISGLQGVLTLGISLVGWTAISSGLATISFQPSPFRNPGRQVRPGDTVTDPNGNTWIVFGWTPLSTGISLLVYSDAQQSAAIAAAAAQYAQQAQQFGQPDGQGGFRFGGDF